MPGNLKAAFKFVLLTVWISFWFVLLTVAYKLKKIAFRDYVMRITSAGILRIIGIRVTVTGSASTIRPLLLVSNHVSYLDVLILNACAPVCFTPKIEIAGWPVIKHIARMSGSIFVDRRAEKINEGKEKIISSLEQDTVVCLFPEATTGTGLHMVPFKSGFFSLAEEAINGEELTIQPAAVTYSHIRRLPIDTTQWPTVAWYGDMELLPHLWNLLKIAPISAEMVFLEPITLQQYGNRKKLAAHCQKVIEDTIQTIRGRHRHVHAKPAKFQPQFLRLKK